MIANGIHSTMSREEYDALPPEIINLSRLKLVRKSPLHFRNAEKAPIPDTKALRFGRLEHWALFEPEKFTANVAIWTGKKKDGKAWDAFKAEAGPKEIATETEYRDAGRMRDAAFADPDVRRLLSDGLPEVTVIWEMHGFKCKTRVDWLSRVHGLSDAKSAVDGSPEAFGKACCSYGYDVQAAWCVDAVYFAEGLELPFHDIAIEKTGGHVTQAYRATDAVLKRGRGLYVRWLERLAEAKASGFWPGYSDGKGILDLTPPEHLMREPAEEEGEHADAA